MTRSTSRTPGDHVHQPSPATLLSVAPVALACAALMSPFAAAAQQAATPPAAAASEAGQLDTVVVQGQRSSLIKAQDIKRNAEQVVDSIVADDIGKLPDANVAEALQRITGVQISRNRGEGDRVQVRGLQQTQTLLNGRVIFSAGKERGLSFQDVPAELLAGADVYKTPTAELIEGGIGGVIDLRTRRPFDFAGFKLAGSVKATQAELVDKNNAEGSVLVSNRWRTASGEFGALLSVSAQKRNYRSDTQELDNPAALADGSGTVAPLGHWLAYEFGERDRKAASASLQWRPDARSEYTLDLNHTRLKSRTDVFGHYASPFWANFSATANQGQLWPNGEIKIDSNGRFVSGTFWGASMSTSGSVADEDTRINQIALAAKWKVADAIVRSDLSHTTSKFDRFYQEVRLGTFSDDPATYSYDLSTKLPSAGSATSQLSNPANYWADKALYFRIKNTGRETAWKTDVDKPVDLGIVTKLRGGVRLADRRADSAEINTIDDLWMFNLSSIPNIGLLPYNDLLKDAGHGNIARQWLTVTNTDWLRDAAAVRGTFNLGIPDFDPAQTFNYKERSGAFYVASDLDTSLAGLPLTGNVGLRAVKTKTARDYSTVAGDRVSLDKSDTDWLPSLNLRLELRPDLQARLGLSRVVTRPNFDQLTPSLSLNVNDRTGYQGNPELDKLRANQVDTTLEYYISQSDSVYGAAFYKEVSGFIQTSSTQSTINGTTYTVTTPTNGRDGRIRGLELGYQGFFNKLPGLLRGLGLQANVTYVDSAAPSPIDGRSAPLEGLSKRSANLVGMYDLGDFSARLAYNWRSAYAIGPRLSYPTNDGVTVQTPVSMKAYGMVDAYFSYALTPKLRIAIEGNNLTKTVRRSTYTDYNLPRGTYTDDRRFAISLRAEL
ncbi:TonB-dependent receptor [Roseateles amylovorans]|uniref:TonB-dependent receptor n=1 Tax=Roseateles amylovorans TaxID=2978473 RepID=A0ABY6B9L0_9BURK|nr:TonB-dependent receptor [Roseateles amylovorans]UXH80601.1 TonB-dependent receptor [Roseateles amylovorans]